MFGIPACARGRWRDTPSANHKGTVQIERLGRQRVLSAAQLCVCVSISVCFIYTLDSNWYTKKGYKLIIQFWLPNTFLILV